jgi:uncharacterized membrane-anchored protein
MLIASLFGTTLGDFFANTLGLGFTGALLPFAIVFISLLVMERRLEITTQFFYWAAVVIARTSATNIADLFTHAFQLNYLALTACLLALLVAILFIGRKFLADRSLRKRGRGEGDALPATDLTYWAAMLFASVLGTTSGDFVADGLGLGTQVGGVILLAVLLAALHTKKKVNVPREASYWIIIVIMRTAGTNMGDFLSSPGGLDLGFGRAAALAGILLIGSIWSGRFMLAGPRVRRLKQNLNN